MRGSQAGGSAPSWRAVGLVLTLLAACGADGGGELPAGEAPAATAATDMADQPPFEEVDPGVYLVDPDGDPGTGPQVRFTITGAGWRAWVGTYKEETEGRTVGLTVAEVADVVADPCHRHTWEDPGPSVDDLAEALATLPGFEVMAGPSDATLAGYAGQRLALRVPDLAYEPGRGFTACNSGYFYGGRAPTDRDRSPTRYYQGPGQELDVWVLDVDGSRLLIEVNRFPASPADDVADLQAIVDSLEIQPRGASRAARSTPRDGVLPRRGDSGGGGRREREATAMSDRDALEALCRREHPRLVRSLALYTGDALLAEELAQDALLAACRRWSEVQRMDSPRLVAPGRPQRRPHPLPATPCRTPGVAAATRWGAVAWPTWNSTGRPRAAARLRRTRGVGDVAAGQPSRGCRALPQPPRGAGLRRVRRVRGVPGTR
jgi:hypothetical protein